jgi:hypothetical protein
VQIFEKKRKIEMWKAKRFCVLKCKKTDVVFLLKTLENNSNFSHTFERLTIAYCVEASSLRSDLICTFSTRSENVFPFSACTAALACSAVA